MAMDDDDDDDGDDDDDDDDGDGDGDGDGDDDYEPLTPTMRIRGVPVSGSGTRESPSEEAEVPFLGIHTGATITRRNGPLLMRKLRSPWADTNEIMDCQF
ncbi:uncharacterized protein BO97DRAFT_406253 [Aspergillus homomorphus CBS 101889]|uniref:Uncharacterized protein n=1 Tax=Aspergillus homomorphus (strain CBS 101889) TaxID=1450537 RepID=A0A395HV99_ASPHC|nr:hypothetical protein BO97DRAFT_406253 [Aspergillus homomorphus CBS 101889]RAL11305.1 hypothetical protein BO97DRAFT_406253 [Aspergillus homomorphus CBS 101889]